MKRKIDKIKNKRLVMGDINNLSSNEILVEQKGDTISLKERVNGEIKEVSGGSNEGGSLNLEYLDLNGLENENYFPGLLQASVSIKAKISNGQMEGNEIVGITTSMFAMLSSNMRDVKSICIDFTSIITQKMGSEVQFTTIENMLLSGGSVTKEQLAAIPRITKEQFYSLD